MYWWAWIVLVCALWGFLELGFFLGRRVGYAGGYREGYVNGYETFARL